MSSMNKTLLLLMVLLVALLGCGTRVEAKRYDLRGEVKGLDASSKTATIAHEKIGDWMEAMTMEFPVKPDAEFQKLHVGDRVEGKVVVEDVKYYLTDVRVVPKQ